LGLEINDVGGGNRNKGTPRPGKAVKRKTERYMYPLR